MVIVYEKSTNNINNIFFDIFSIESFGDSILFERSMLLALFISMGIHIYKNMENHPE